MNSIFTNVAKDAAVTGTLTGGAVLLGVTGSAMIKPEFGGDTKDYSKAIDTSTNIGMGLAMAYLGIKYGRMANDLGRSIFLRGSAVSPPPNTSVNSARILGQLGYDTSVPPVTTRVP